MVSLKSFSSSFLSTKIVRIIKLLKFLCDVLIFFFKLIITTIYSVPAEAKHCARCFTYMLSNSLILCKFCYLYLKAEYLLIPRSWLLK